MALEGIILLVDGVYKGPDGLKGLFPEHDRCLLLHTDSEKKIDRYEQKAQVKKDMEKDHLTQQNIHRGYYKGENKEVQEQQVDLIARMPDIVYFLLIVGQKFVVLNSGQNHNRTAAY
jgi:hypothetical protein